MKEEFKRRFNIAFDFDDVLVKHIVPFYEIAGEEFGVKLECCKKWLYPEYEEEIRKFIDELWQKEWYMIGCILPKPGMIEHLKWLMSLGHNVYIITARPHFQEETVEKAVKMGFVFKDFIFGGYRKGDKVDNMEEYNIDIWVDDNPLVIEKLLTTNIKPIIMDMPYNKELSSEVPRIYNAIGLNGQMWETMREIIDAEEKQG